MKENIIIHAGSNKRQMRIIIVTMIAITCCLTIISFIRTKVLENEYYYSTRKYDVTDRAGVMIIASSLEEYETSVKITIACIIAGASIILLIYFIMGKVELTITDKRAYGKAILGKRVDIPLDSISSIGKGICSSISIASSSGKILFVYIDKRDKVYSVVSKLIIDREDSNVNNSNVKKHVINNQLPLSNADEIRKYRELLDANIISQEEFEEKKKQLLGI